MSSIDPLFEYPLHAPRNFNGEGRIGTVFDFGARGDGITLDSLALQEAIDRCAADGGGTVCIPAGRYLCGSLFLKSNVTLHLAAGAVLLGSRDPDDYAAPFSEFRDAVGVTRGSALINAYQQENIVIEGRGIIDGQGSGWQNPRPMLLRFVECRDLTVNNVTLKDSAAWVQHYLRCSDVRITGVRVKSHCNSNNDGINLDGCERVIVSDCNFSSGDDAFTLKCTSDQPCRDIVVTNCIFQSECNGIKFGTESIGGFENISISNCAVYDTRLGGITLATVDGAYLRNIVISNIAMRGAGTAIFMRLGSRGYHLEPAIHPRPVGEMKGIVIRDVVATGIQGVGSAILGLPDRPVEDVILENIFISAAGGGRLCADELPELPDSYPEYTRWGVFPAYGLYCRHVRGLVLRHIKLELAAVDERPAFAFESVKELQQEGCTGANRLACYDHTKV